MGHGFNGRKQRKVSRDDRLHCSLKTCWILFRGFQCWDKHWSSHVFGSCSITGIIHSPCINFFNWGRMGRYRALNPRPHACQASTQPLNCSPQNMLRSGGWSVQCCKPSSCLTSMSLNLKSGTQKQNSIKIVLAGCVWFWKVNTRWQHVGRFVWIS